MKPHISYISSEDFSPKNDVIILDWTDWNWEISEIDQKNIKTKNFELAWKELSWIIISKVLSDVELILKWSWWLSLYMYSKEKWKIWLFNISIESLKNWIFQNLTKYICNNLSIYLEIWPNNHIITINKHDLYNLFSHINSEEFKNHKIFRSKDYILPDFDEILDWPNNVVKINLLNLFLDLLYAYWIENIKVNVKEFNSSRLMTEIHISR